MLSTLRAFSRLSGARLGIGGGDAWLLERRISHLNFPLVGSSVARCERATGKTKMMFTNPFFCC